MLQKACAVVANRCLSYNTNNMERGAGENQTPAGGEPAAPLSTQPPHVEDGPQVIFWLATARKAIALKQTMYLIIWLALHHINREHDSSGILPADEQTTTQLVDLVGLSLRQVTDILKAGDGAWWQHLPETRLRLFSQEKTSNRLTSLATEADVADPGEPEVRCRMPLATLRASQKDFESFIFDAWVAERRPDGLRTTWDKVTRLWACSQTQIMDWIEAVGTKRQSSAGSLSSLSPKGNPDIFEYHSSRTSSRTHTPGKARKANRRRGHRR